jgi:hypothetical protein
MEDLEDIVSVWLDMEVVDLEEEREIQLLVREQLVEYRLFLSQEVLWLVVVADC